MPRRAWSLAAAVLCLAAAPVLAGDYRDEARHFSFAVPDDWVRMPRFEIDFINDLSGFRPNYQPGLRYELGFRPKDAHPGELPCVLIQPIPGSLRGSDFEDVKRSLNPQGNASVREGAGAIRTLIKDLPVGSAVLDRSKNRIVFRLTRDGQDATSSWVMGVAHLGADEGVMVYCYAPPQDHDRWLPQFEQINESFQFDPGYTFTPSSGSSWGTALQRAVIGGIAGFLVVHLYRRVRREQSSDSTGPEPHAP